MNTKYVFPINFTVASWMNSQEEFAVLRKSFGKGVSVLE